uniref:Uncharacterized protein n=1 Tax=Setaria digitata TaxID=48799 RepID=A0A915PRP2_9BILA
MILKYFSVVIVLVFATLVVQSNKSDLLWINTTYQAEDIGIRHTELSQCKAWNLWWKFQRGDIAPKAEIIDLLSTRRKVASLKNIVHINFEEICKNHSRYLLIDSLTSADTEPSPESNVRELELKQPSVLFIAKYNQDHNLERIDSSPLIRSGIRIVNPKAEITYQIKTDSKKMASVVVVRNQEAANFFKLGEMTTAFTLHKGIQIDLKKVCVPQESDTNGEISVIKNFTEEIKAAQNSSETKVDNEKAKKKITSREKISTLTAMFRRGIQLSTILNIFDNGMMANLVPFSSSLLIPLLNKTHYDSRSPPTILEDTIAEVFFGIFIQSMSNFEQSTMVFLDKQDYDMDIWLRMAWLDSRLAHQFDRPILINDKDTLRQFFFTDFWTNYHIFIFTQTYIQKIWRPAPFFQNAKEAEYHRMTVMNFWLYIFPNGEIFFETHLYLKPSCKLILCKYPHDKQVCSLKITAIASGQNSVRYRWFPQLSDAIRMNKNMELGELYIEKYYKEYCDGLRKTGNFSCLEASFRLERHLGYHMTRTYIPTATCVVFSWISVWLPEEFVTGRIFGSLTLFLTLSAESSAVKEVLPKVSYMKAIDLWFGFTASFVFITMLEALTVIWLEYRSRELRRKAEAGVDDMSRYQMMLLMLKSSRYHSIARHIDRYCRTLYPVVFLLFLIIYYFVITEGDETKCLQRVNDEL